MKFPDLKTVVIVLVVLYAIFVMDWHATFVEERPDNSPWAVSP